jgi:F-type H+-transporting ATPase subunit delta
MHNLQQSADLRACLASPVIPSLKKLDVLKALYADRFSPLLNLFFATISRRGREPLLKEIMADFLELYLLRKGIVAGYVTSATPLTAKALAEVQTLADSISGKQVQLVQTVNPSLVGGFVLRVGDKQIDQTVTSRIERVRRSLKATA